MSALALTTVAVAALAGCSSSGAPSPHTSAVVAPTPTPTTTATTVAPVGSAGMSFTGAFSATVSVNLCRSGVASISVHVAGDSQRYLGSISARAFGFVGPGAAEYSLKAGAAKPTASANGTAFTVRGVPLIDLVSGRTVTATGTVTCP